MPTYLALHKHRKEGAQTIKQLPERVEQAKQLANSMDCDVEFYLTNGQFDAAVIIDAPDEQTAKQLALAVNGTGTVTTEFQRAFHESEIEELTDGIPEP
ncbi:GYD family protein [halophilic archaeon DL31]|jgi:uncharacterized protein with GYD domain|nr:GYD family protein [halophilic archaeon DL31]